MGFTSKQGMILIYFKIVKVELSGIVRYRVKDIPNKRIVKKYNSIVFFDIRAMNKNIIPISE